MKKNQTSTMTTIVDININLRDNENVTLEYLDILSEYGYVLMINNKQGWSPIYTT